MAEIGFRKFIITLTVIAAAVIELIDTSIVNVALSNMSGNLGSTLEDTAWVVTSYAIANVIIIPMTSFLAARFGRRNYYIGSILLFTAASMACGQAHNIWELVAFRFMQGIGGGALLSTSQAILFETFPLSQRGLAAALFSVGVFIGPTIGPTVGGWIIDNYSWPWIFYINLPIGVAAAILSYIYVKEPAQARSAAHIDWLGITLLIAGLGALQTVLERGETEDWFSSHWIVALTIVSALSLLGFVVWQLIAKHPVVDLRVLRSRALATAATLTFVLGFALFASVFIVPIFVQRLLGFSAFETGMLFLPGAGVAVLLLPLVGRALMRGVSPQWMVVTGFLIVAVFAAMLGHLNLAAGPGQFFWPIILRAVGLCLLTVPLTQLAVSGLKTRDIPQGVALNNMMRQLGGSFGIAFINTFLDHRAAVHRLDLVSRLAPGDPATDARLAQITASLSHQGYSPWEAAHRAWAVVEMLVQRQSSLLSYLDAYRLVAAICLCCVPLILLAGRPKTLDAAASAAASESH
ncbi:MAG TPA: DHA2 family efflux MFS transporter permease subunit [Opitutaceae bacterium]|jgi:DHA2 family multidrug resistance protein|nr:DHA2 family efflux MFS transporter permease subunit [Opitutaceae bacterium]